MSGPAGCQVTGRWRIVASDLWDRDYLDLVGPAYFQIGAAGRAEFRFGAVDATAELEYGGRIIFFHWSGFDEGDAIGGDGSAELQDDDSLEIGLSFDDGDDAILTAHREMTFFNSLLGHSAHVRQNDFVGEPCENGHAAMGVITARAGDALCVGRDLDRPLGSFFELGAWSPSLPGSFSSTDAAIRRSGASAPYRNRVLRAGECPFGRKEHRPST
jgi:hypothetical protein